jgi:cephalosporin hydroxylase
MSIIRFTTEEVFGTDSQEYEVLYNAAKKVSVPGAVVEIGTRRGGSAKLMMDALVETRQNNRPFICIDPYGNIEIECTNLNMSVHYPGTNIEGAADSKEITSPHRFDYTNEMRNRVIPSLYFYAYQAGFDFRFFQLTDYQFFELYKKGVPFYDQKEEFINEYAMVFFDGPHTTKEVLAETEFFVKRSRIGTVFVYDDEWMLDTEGTIIPYLLSNGFEILERKNIKGSYIRTK